MNLKKNSQGGFSLIELVMVLVIMSIISLVIAKILFQGYQLFVTSQNIADVDWRGFLALERITDDIHTIRSAADMTTTQAALLTFTDVTGTSIQYQLSGSNLQRNSQTLASGMTSFALSYLDKNGVVTAVPASVRYISISLSLSQGTTSTVFSTLAATRGMT